MKTLFQLGLFAVLCGPALAGDANTIPDAYAAVRYAKTWETNLFLRDVRPPPPPPVDALNDYALGGIVIEGNRKTAYIRNTMTQKLVALDVGQTVDGMTALDILSSPDRTKSEVLIRIGSQEGKLRFQSVENNAVAPARVVNEAQRERRRLVLPQKPQ